MQKSLFVISLVSVVTVSPLLAQSGSDRISRPRDDSRAPAPGQGTQHPMGDITFTNKAGESYTMTELASRLQELRTAVDGALPLLSAFNQNFSNTLASQPGGLSGAIAGILSGARSNSGSQEGESSSSPALSNIVSVLGGLLGTNAAVAGSTGASVNTNTVHDLLALEGELQPVASVLRSLNLNVATSSELPRSGDQATPLKDDEEIPTPTGRQ